MLAGLVHYPDGPISSAVDSAPYALAAGYLDVADDVMTRELDERNAAARQLEGTDGVIAGHGS